MSKSAMHFELALVEAIHVELVGGRQVTIPGLGTLSVDHQPARIESIESTDTGSEEYGSAIVHPPVNRISFVADIQSSHLPESNSRQ